MKLPYVVKDQSEIDSALEKLTGEVVCVSWVKDTELLRHNFEPQISVQNILEGSSKTGKYRVLVDDNTHSYFYNDVVWCVVQDVGKRAIIFIS
jgi:hypothetical protein